MSDGSSSLLREAMVEMHLAGRGISNPAVLDAFLMVRREDFVRPEDVDRAYDDTALPLGMPGETVSQPFAVAWIAELADVTPGCRLLEIGTGSGYTAAILATTGAQVWTVERNPTLAREAAERLAPFGVQVRTGEGREGWPEAGPFDRIVISAACEAMAPAWFTQLAPGGRIVAPVVCGGSQTLRVFSDGVWADHGAVRFAALQPDAVSAEP